MDGKEVTQKKNRIHSQIVSEILDRCAEPQTKTSIMYRSNLSYNMLTNYLLELQNAGLIESTLSSKAKYVRSVKGQKYLKKYLELQEIADLSTHYPSENTNLYIFEILRKNSIIRST